MMKSLALLVGAMMASEASLLRRRNRVAFIAEFGRGIDPQKEAQK